MRAAAERMVGERDFGALGSDAHGSTIRNLAEVRVTRRGELVEVRVTANAFLRRMVRGIVAILVQVGRGRLAPEAVTELLDRPGRALDGRAAPARGLTLERVIYPSATSTTERRTTRAPTVARATGMTGEQGT
jgi:tRNA pseudouridine38-40 synthase